MTAVSTSGSQGPRMTMQRSLHRQCPNCCAPGKYLNSTLIRDGYSEAQITEMVEDDPSMASKVSYFRTGWPKCYVEMNDPRRDQPVGTNCPQCGALRPKPKILQTMKVRGRLF